MAMSVRFFVVERKNVFCKKGTEWALYAMFDENMYSGGNGTWAIETWEHSPTHEEVCEAKNIAKRCFNVMLKSLIMPTSVVEAEECRPSMILPNVSALFVS